MSRRRALIRLFVLAVAGPLVTRAARAASPVAFRVIVNPANPMTAVERRFLADLFLKKVTRWPTGDPARPVDLGQESPTRLRFTDDVLGRSVGAVRSYWAQLVFSGRDVPPPELDGDEDVVRYVLKHVGAVGYVSPAAIVDRVKVLPLR